MSHNLIGRPMDDQERSGGVMEEAISPDLNWRLLGPGSAGCYLELGGQYVELRTSYLGMRFVA
jgi:hypothetical protein